MLPLPRLREFAENARKKPGRSLAAAGQAPEGSARLLRTALVAEVALIAAVPAATAVLVGHPPPARLAGGPRGRRHPLRSESGVIVQRMRSQDGRTWVSSELGSLPEPPRRRGSAPTLVAALVAALGLAFVALNHALALQVVAAGVGAIPIIGEVALASRGWPRRRRSELHRLALAAGFLILLPRRLPFERRDRPLSLSPVREG